MRAKKKKQEAAVKNMHDSKQIKANKRILLADDHSVTREELAALLNHEPDLEVVGEACNGEEVVELARELLPDVVIMDVFMPLQSGIDATQKIISKNPNIKVIGFSVHPGPDIVSAMEKAGASACISKSDPIDVLVQAIQSDPPGRDR